MSLASPTLRRAKPAETNFELYSWYFFRLSGLLLVFLALGHLVIMHVINSVDVIDARFVAARWANPFWRAYDWLILLLGVLHGANGVRIVLDDYLRARGWRVFAQSLLFVLTTAVILIGTIAVLTFQPSSVMR